MKRSLPKKRDSQLEEPYRSWINGKVSLPEDVTILPRKIAVQPAAMLFVAVVLGCATFATLLLPGAFASLPTDESTDSFLTVVLIGSLTVFLPFLTLGHLFVTLSARRELSRRKLRQGIIVGSVGILVRLAPNKCFVIPLERFLRAVRWSGGGDCTEEFICIETQDGKIDFSERSLSVDAAAINQSVFEARVSRASVEKQVR